MDIAVLGAGMMGKAIAFDLEKYSRFGNIILVDKNKKILKLAKDFLSSKDIIFKILDIKNLENIKDFFKSIDIAISAIPYYYNYELTKIAIETSTNFLDLGGNNDVVNLQRNLMSNALENDVLVIPDCGLAPGLVSVIVKDIIEHVEFVDYIKIRVGGLPLHPKPPLNYQIVFSPNGLINEYVEDAIILDHGKIIKKKSMTDIEEVIFPKPFGNMEAFVTSGGCSTLPYTYKDKIGYLDYKTVRYKGHCENFKPLLNIKPREKLIEYLLDNLPVNGKDVVLLKVLSKVTKSGIKGLLDYTMIDYYDESNNITSMMRTTAYPTSIIAQLINQNVISKKGVYCCEDIVPTSVFINELEKRNIKIFKEFR